jgi:hypothetical protein
MTTLILAVGDKLNAKRIRRHAVRGKYLNTLEKNQHEHKQRTTP